MASAVVAASFEPKAHAFTVTRSIVAAKSVGHTSLVFRVDYDDGTRVALKPRSRRGKDRFRGEIAAFRLSRALGLDNVPEARFERIVAAELVRALGGESTPGGKLAAAELVVDGNGRSHAALIDWVPKLEYLALEKDGARDAALRERKDGRATEVASQLADLVVFDFITGNWDRWSGGNVGFVSESKRVVFVDNDGAFFDPVPKDALARQLRILKGLEFLPTGLVARARSFDDATLAAALGDEAPGDALLTASVRKAILERIAIILEVAEARLAKAAPLKD